MKQIISHIKLLTAHEDVSRAGTANTGAFVHRVSTRERNQATEIHRMSSVSIGSNSGFTIAAGTSNYVPIDGHVIGEAWKMGT